MTRDETKLLLPTLQAYSEGKQIQVLSCGGVWVNGNSHIRFNEDPKNYRIKPLHIQVVHIIPFGNGPYLEVLQGTLEEIERIKEHFKKQGILGKIIIEPVPHI